jgi:antitoxin Phd
MQTISANDAKQSLGRVIDAAQREPVVIQRHNRDVAVVISPQDYDRLRAVNLKEISDLCDRVSSEARAKGLTEERLAALLADDGA